jgi:hypothetical protein
MGELTVGPDPARADRYHFRQGEKVALNVDGMRVVCEVVEFDEETGEGTFAVPPIVNPKAFVFYQQPESP